MSERSAGTTATATPAAWRLGLAIVVALAVAGCGVRGNLENPDAAKPSKTATADSGQGKKEGDAPKPHKDFILDGLIR